jgi:hypothetical protein
VVVVQNITFVLLRVRFGASEISFTVKLVPRSEYMGMSFGIGKVSHQPLVNFELGVSVAPSPGLVNFILVNHFVGAPDLIQVPLHLGMLPNDLF